MSLPSNPPQYASFRDIVVSIRPGELNSWRVYSLQRALMTLGYDLPLWHADGSYSVDGETRAVVCKFQLHEKLVVDGIVGPATQGSLLGLIEAKVHASIAGLPLGVLKGFTMVEGAGVLAATNWSVPGGVDCGAVQWRVLGAPFSLERLYTEKGVELPTLKAAFDVKTSFNYAGRILLERVAQYNSLRPSLSDATVLRCALLAHNWPAGALYYVNNGRLPNPNAPAGWTKNPNTGMPYTQAEWFQEYPDRILAYVK